MTKFLLLIPAVMLAVLALLTLVRAPDWTIAWKLAILSGEYGHWLIVLPIGLAVGAWWGAAGGWRVAIWLCCVIAAIGFHRPAASARRLAATLPQGLEAAFGAHEPKRPAFRWAALYGGRSRPTAVVTTEVYSRPGGEDQRLDLYRSNVTKDVRQPLRPCVVVIHGGGWDSGDRLQLPEWNHWLVGHGLVVAAIDYRLAPRWEWPVQREDTMAAIAWLKEHAAEFGIDRSQFILFGRSAGGQIATAVAYGAHDPSIRGVVALYAPHDLPFVWSIAREDDVLNSVKLMRQYLGGPPDDGRKANYESASAQYLARADSPPTLLVHGELDTLSWVRHGERLSGRLEELKVPHYFLRLPWATHAFDFNPNGPGSELTGYALEWFLASVTKSG